jgi:dephospho-CoA kinase
LTGGIGSGKSTVAAILQGMGARIIDTDEISHALTARDGDAIPAIAQAFGRDFIDAQGALDRPRMRALFFADASAKHRLQDILHPLILQRARMLAAQPVDAPYTLVVVPLLFESGRYRDWLQRIVVVDCPEDEQIARTRARSHLDEATVRNIMAQQLPRQERLVLADEVVHNDGDLDALRPQLIALHARLQADKSI